MKVKWKPQEDEWFYFIESDWTIDEFQWNPDYPGDVYRLSDKIRCVDTGNCFKTKAEAQKVLAAINKMFREGLPESPADQSAKKGDDSNG